MLFTQLSVTMYVIFEIGLFVILAISHFGYKGRNSVLIVSFPGNCHIAPYKVVWHALVIHTEAKP